MVWVGGGEFLLDDKMQVLIRLTWPKEIESAVAQSHPPGFVGLSDLGFLGQTPGRRAAVQPCREDHPAKLHPRIAEGESAVVLLLATPFVPAAHGLGEGILHGSDGQCTGHTVIATEPFSPYGLRPGGFGCLPVWIEMYMRLRSLVRSLVISLYNALFARAVEKLFFHQLVTKTNNFGKSNWLGKPIWQNTFDLWIAQETIYEVKPSLIIECGTNRGGSAYFYAQLFDLMDTDGKVVSVDIEKLHDLSHPRVTYLVGSSASEEIASQIRKMAEEANGPVLVILDSDHSEEHVAKELELYAPLTTVGSYCLVQDGIIDELFMFRKGRPGPLPALEKYLSHHSEFEIDHERCERFLITHHPKGWLKRIK